MKKPPTIADVKLPEEEGIYTFSNGTAWDCWASGNCYECKWWDPPDECAFFTPKQDENGDPTPDRPVIDPAQLSFLPPDGWPGVPVPEPVVHLLETRG